MGAGGSLEAAFRLAGPIKAGNWHLVGDGVTFDPCTVTFAVLWRSSAGDKTIVSYTHQFAKSGPIMANHYAPAIEYEGDAMGAEVPAQPDDQLVLRFSAAANTTDTPVYVPNGDGTKALGRIPSLTLPQ